MMMSQCVSYLPLADDVKTTSTILWLLGYFLNIALNVTVFMRILAKDTVDYVVYLLCTGALSIARLIFLKYKKDNGELEVYYILTDGKHRIVMEFCTALIIRFHSLYSTLYCHHVLRVRQHGKASGRLFANEKR